nr:biotin--[acetyl-CoA-carboxylase] ligase [Deinococcus maricopensis]
MPDRLLKHLTETPQSGQTLAAHLGMGRVNIHNLAHALIEQGVPVQVTRRGYALTPGTPARVHARGTFGRAYRYLGTTTSTQDALRAWADDPHDPAPHGAVILAERQTLGRGRRGRPWHAPGGALTFSALLRGPIPLRDLAHLPLAAGVAVARAAGVGGLKWPNDLLAPDGRKLAGILLEADVRGEEARHAVLGVGLNVHAAPDGAAHLSAWRDVTRSALLRELLAQFDEWLARPPAEVLVAWRAASVTLGRPVRVTTPAGIIEGVAEDLDAEGSLLVRADHGVVRVGAGDVELVGTFTSPTLQEDPS